MLCGCPIEWSRQLCGCPIEKLVDSPPEVGVGAGQGFEVVGAGQGFEVVGAVVAVHGGSFLWVFVKVLGTFFASSGTSPMGFYVLDLYECLLAG